MILTPIADIDNIIFKTVREIQVIDIDKINYQIKSIQIDHRPIFNFLERVIYYEEVPYGKYKRLTKMIMPCCCIKCGNYMNRSIKYSKINLKCKCDNNY